MSDIGWVHDLTLAAEQARASGRLILLDFFSPT
jgi:hypothetical protein